MQWCISFERQIFVYFVTLPKTINQHVLTCLVNISCCDYSQSVHIICVCGGSQPGDNNDLTQFYCPQWLVTAPNALPYQVRVKAIFKILEEVTLPFLPSQSQLFMMRAFASWTYPPYSFRGQIDGQIQGQGRLPVRVENVGEPLLLFLCNRIENYTKRAAGL